MPVLTHPSTSTSSPRRHIRSGRRVAVVSLVLACCAPILVSSALAQTSFLLDQQPGALAAYSLRKLSSTYDGAAIQVRNVSNGVKQDIGFDASGLVDTQELQAFCAGTDCRVAKWYSQLAGVPDAVQTIETLQPYIVESGNVVRDDGGYVAMHFINLGSTPSTYFAVSGMTAYSSQDITVFSVVDNSENGSQSGWRNLLSLQTPGEPGYMATGMAFGNDGTGQVTVGDGQAAATQYNGFQPQLVRGTYTLYDSGTTVAAYRNELVIEEKTHTRTAYSPTGFAIGGDSRDGTGAYSGFISEVVLYPALSDENRLAVYDNINATWKTGPASPNAGALLPQDWQYQVVLYDWLETITTDDIAIEPKPLTWDGSYADAGALANLWLSLQDNPVAEPATRGQACWYVLDDGSGCGIEATGAVRIFYKGNDGNTGAYELDAAFWYQLDVPLADGGQGNYYYKNPAVARRALIMAAVEMMMWDRTLDEVPSMKRNDYYGKAVSAWAYVYYNCREVLPADVQEAFEAGIERFLDRTIDWGAHDINTNMDTFFAQGAAIFYKATSSPERKRKAVQAVKRLLFGYTDGAIGTRQDVLEGAFFPAGYIGEADGPETTYNGVSFYNMVGALSYVYDQPEWAFLEEVVRRMAVFKEYQYFDDPPVNGTSQPFYDGPAGYANRTGGSYVRDQRGPAWRDLTAADLIPEARPLARPYTHLNNPNIKSEGEMTKDLFRSLTRINSYSFDVIDTEQPPVFKAGSSWPPDRAYLPPPGWYGRLKALLDANDPSMDLPLDRSGFYYNKMFGGPPTGGEFWVYKARDSNAAPPEDFAFFVEADAQQGGYPGWYGGKLEAFWTEETGMLIMNRHDKTGNEVKENTTRWDEIDYWGANHVWGRDENGSAFSSAGIRGRQINRTAEIQTDAPVPFAQVVNQFNDPNGSDSDDGEQTGNELGGKVSVTNRFEALPNGVLVSNMVTSDQTDQITELWATIPIYLRYNNKEQGGQASLSDATIEYWDGSTWQSLTTTLVKTAVLRIGRDYLDGRGPRYGYISFRRSDSDALTPRSVKLSSQVWEESYMGRTRLRNVHIDLHGNPGTVIRMPAEVEVDYAVTTTSPLAGGSTPPSDKTSQEIGLSPGWNIVSSTLKPSDTNLSSVFSGVADTALVVKDQNGLVYVPRDGINQIKSWSPSAAYMVHVGANTRLDLTGQPLSAGAVSILLKQGWNLLPFPRNNAQPLEVALQPILSNVVMIKSESGQVYAPEYDVNTVGNLLPGEGYWIYVNAPVTLTF